MSVQKNIRLYLTKNELSNRWLSNKLGLTEQTLSRILREKTFLKLDVYVAITNILGVPVDYFIDDDMENKVAEDTPANYIQLEMCEVKQ